MKVCSFLYTFLLLCAGIHAQTQIGGVINSYAAVTELSECAGQIEVRNSDGFAVGQAVLLIQMKGAELLIEESPAFGDIIDLGGAGLYERGRIAAINGNTVVLEKVPANTYDPAGALQLVSLPEYENATITDPLTARPWDGETGGILALEVSGTLRLEADIDVSGQGFRGGLSEVNYDDQCGFNRNIRDYGVDRTNWRGAPKGEGIGITVNKENARGPQGNGGGGGNDHNSGGGGGANTSAGGQGGENLEPSFFGCKGRNPGLGGKPAPAQPGRLYLGGGGGGGHENNDNGSSGGNGGGLLVLLAGTIESNGRQILANGVSAEETYGDGAGGGGAGGTVLLRADQINGDLPVQANGGDGGSIDNRGEERCFGPGGGGSGGRVLSNQLNALTIEVNPGDAGTSFDSISCPESTNGGQPGTAGLTADAPDLPEGEAAAGAPAILQQPGNQQACAGEALTLIVATQGSITGFQWEVDRGNGFTALAAGASVTGVDSPRLTINALADEQSGYRYRLRLLSDCFDDILSEPVEVNVGAISESSFTVDQDGATVQLSNQSSNADAYRWDFGDGNNSTASEPAHTYQSSGRYVITLTVEGNCGTDTSQAVVEVVLEPVVAFDAVPGEGCAPLEVQFQNSSLGAENYRWRFPGGAPATSNEAEPLVRYTSAGTFDVELIADNEAGSDTLLLTGFIRVGQPPAADFITEVSEQTVRLLDNSSNADRYSWDFGDGNRSDQPSPTHVYAAPGRYDVLLTVENECGRDTAAQRILAGSIPQANFRIDAPNGCTPHIVRFEDASSGIFDRHEWFFPGGDPQTSTEPNPQVIYREAGDYDVMLILQSSLGNDTLSLPNAVKIRTFPEPAFQFELLGGGEVAFTNQSSGGDTFRWDFGDGTTSREENPTHTYAESGAYEVTLNAQNGSCASAVNQTLVIMLTGTAVVPLPFDLRVFPNPAHDKLWIQMDNLLLLPLYGTLYAPSGQRVLAMKPMGNQPVDVSGLPTGMYLLVLESTQGKWAVKVVLQ